MNIAAIRKRRHLTQEHLAEMIGASQATISRAEKGDDGVTIQQYRAIAAALKVPLWELFADNLTTEEALLLEAYRRLEPARQTGWLEVARALAEDRELPTQ